MDTECEEVQDLSHRFEEMEVDLSENEVASALMDEKILKKEKQNEEKDELFWKEKAKVEMKKKIAEKDKF